MVIGIGIVDNINIIRYITFSMGENVNEARHTRLLCQLQGRLLFPILVVRKEKKRKKI
jgi:hypothetical protein